MKRINIVKFKSNPQSWQNEMQRITENQVFNQRYYTLYICTRKLSNLTIQYITKLHLNKTKTFKHVTWIAAINWNDVRSIQYVVYSYAIQQNSNITNTNSTNLWLLGILNVSHQSPYINLWKIVKYSFKIFKHLSLWNNYIFWHLQCSKKI